MKVDYTNPVIQELAFLMRIPQIKRHLEATMDQQKEIFKNEISELIRDTAGKVRPMPTFNSQDYFFQLSRDKESGLWNTVIENNVFSVPVNSILPPKLIFQLAEHEVDSDGTHHLEYKSTTYLHKLYFTRYTLNHIAGTIQVIPLADQDGDIPVLEIDQYLNLSPDNQEKIFLKYLEIFPDIKQDVIFHFFSYILPNSEQYKK